MSVEGKIYFRGCSRCGGDMILSKDMYGWFKECIQCGFEIDEQGSSGGPDTLYRLGEVITSEVS